MVLQKDGAAEGWCCRRMVPQSRRMLLQEGGAEGGWCCRRMVLQKEGSAVQKDGAAAGVSSSLMANRSKLWKKTFKKSKRQLSLQYFRDAVTDVVTAL
jgi:hypothetical protein